MFAAYIQPVVATYGLWAVFFIVMFESAGVPLPGETALVTAAIYAGVTGDLRLVEVIAVAATGAIIGDNIGFWIGRRYGMPLLHRHGHLIKLNEKRLALGELLFERHGAKIVFFGRFIAFLRIFAALLAGVYRFGWGQFLFYNAAGGIVWATVFGVGGFIFGDAITKLSGPIGVGAFVAAIAGIVGFMWVAKRGEEHYFAKMEREAEGRVRRAPEGEGGPR
jgi:membrane protein DedA with SNARE-associated domain